VSPTIVARGRIVGLPHRRVHGCLRRRRPRTGGAVFVEQRRPTPTSASRRSTSCRSRRTRSRSSWGLGEHVTTQISRL